MDGVSIADRISGALARIEAASARIEAAAKAPRAASADPDLEARYDKLQREAGAALEQIEQLIGTLEP